MSGRPLRAALAEYLAVRRSVGFKLARDGLLLEQFAGFCEQAGASRVTSELALAWVSAPAKASPGWLAMRLTIVRGFARWLQASDPATEVPPLGWLPPRRRTTPYLYSAADVAALLAAARRVRWPLSAAAYETLISLLAVTGMRIGDLGLRSCFTPARSARWAATCAAAGSCHRCRVSRPCSSTPPATG